MERIDRRAFLAAGVKTGVVLAAGAAGGVAVEGAVSPSAAEGAPSARRNGPGPPEGLTTTGVDGAVGVDPDDTLFAWRVSDPRRGAHQAGYRIVVTGPDHTGTTVWDSGEVVGAQQAFVPYGGPLLRRPAPATGGGSGQLIRLGAGVPRARRPPSPPGCGRRTGRPSGCDPGPAAPGVEEYTYLRTVRSLPVGTISSGHRLRGGRPPVPAVGQRGQGRQRPELLLPRRAVLPGHGHHRALAAGPGERASASSTTGTGRAGDGRPRRPGPWSRWWPTSPTAAHGGARLGPRLADRPAEWLPAPQRNNDSGDFVEWIDARRHPTGWSDAEFDDTAGLRPPCWARRHAPSPASTPSGPTSSRSGCPGVGPDAPERRRGRRLRQGLRRPARGGLPPRGRPGAPCPCRGYILDPDGAVSTTHGTQGTDLSFSLVQRDGAQVFDALLVPGVPLPRDRRSRRGAGHRPGVPGGPPRRHARAAAATFSSSPELDAVWDLCAHSALFCAQDQFIDTPTREQGQFLWDAANESEVVQRVFGEPT